MPVNTQTISHFLFPYRQFLVGFSGGLDSTVLLYRLKLWRDEDPTIKIRAVHVHHGLSSISDNWVKHCKTMCFKWKISLVVVYISVPKKKCNIESEARSMRYAAFKDTLLPDEVLVTAHHLDDQCETFLLALKRGSGPTGLSSMPTRIKFSDTYLLRPLLQESRKSLKAWAQTNLLHWVEDESNKDDRYDRNFLRLHIIPLLNERWPNISNAIARSATLCAEQERLLDEFLSVEMKTLVSERGSLEIKPLVKMTEQRRFAILRRWISSKELTMPSSSMLHRIWKEVAQARKDAMPCIYLHGYNVRRFKEMLWLVESYPSCSDIIILWHNPYEKLLLPYNMGSVILKNGEGHISPPLEEEIVSIRFKAKGMIHIVGRDRRRKLKKIWQEIDIPPWDRCRIPLLFYNERLIAAVGKFITREGWVKKGICFERIV